MEDKLIKCLQTEIELYKNLGLESSNLNNQTTKWKNRVAKEPSRFIKSGYKLDVESLKNFRRLNILLDDWPQFDLNKFSPRKYYGSNWACRKWLINCLRVLKNFKYDSLLTKYPCDPVGNPIIFQYMGYQYTYRWLKQVYQLGLLEKTLSDRLKNDFTCLDLGCGYGIFSSLVKKEFPDSHHILVDFPEQLILAYYFLGTCFPEARIAGIKQIQDKAEITRSFVEQYDFVLVPVTFYKKLQKETTDLYTNFVSLAEMKREWFDYYLKSAPFLTARYFYTINRIISQPTYDTDVTFLDYIANKPKDVLYFAIHPFPSSIDKVRYLFLHERVISPPLFEYICKI